MVKETNSNNNDDHKSLTTQQADFKLRKSD